MKLFNTLIFLNFFLFSNSLAPKKLPNGNTRIFVHNFKKPESDLKILSPSETSLICKNWMSNILLNIPVKSKVLIKLIVMTYI